MWIRMGCACLILLAMLPAAYAGKPTKDEIAFTQGMAALFRAKLGDREVTIKGPLTLALGTYQVNLDRLYVFCRRNSEDCVKQADHFVDYSIHMRQEARTALSPESLRVVVRSSAYVDQINALLKSHHTALMARPLCKGLDVLVVMDTPHAIRPLQQSDARKLGMTADQMFRLAGRNTLAGLKPLSQETRALAPGEIGVIDGDEYEVGRVAMVSQWAPLAQQQHGTLLIDIPAADTVLYADDDSRNSVAAMRTEASRLAYMSARPLAPSVVLKWKGDHWVTLP